ncbi:hypothetical protein COT94_01085 [Candidatus Falkowbacteria bacterium CG10_big_fil_rev_8_21_14_0_10_37_14]|uniref:Uncharacterized protein n=1 Tax=Candidatus Falkowbacteria bacterium CG10_big_fil_rev_8_21_14_0_10_37_14 TaxID=1974561 RepID=A0A2M6WU02_9BACT|nr:hypothetical protein [Candidatus Falkowbacteria bacterium]PIT96269.1 MAG: hypothetical protein COT94_01085 [Candidatus Falkowbacteria bacterium CG10_big_fil_rev_8_21_14_0_10_37_14]
MVKGVKINEEGAKKLVELGNKDRAKSVVVNKKRRQVAWQKMADNSVLVSKDLLNCDVDYCKILLAMLYWGEGTKTVRQLVFMNSNPKIIKMYLFLLLKVFVINESKLKTYLHLHDYHDRDRMINYWSDITGINKKTNKNLL